MDAFVLKELIEKTRKELYELVASVGNLQTREVIELSQRLDKLLIEYQRSNKKKIPPQRTGKPEVNTFLL